jgi:hypothetical protein
LNPGSVAGGSEKKELAPPNTKIEVKFNNRGKVADTPQEDAEPE